MNLRKIVLTSAIAVTVISSNPVLADDLAVGITRSMSKFEGTVNGKKITIMRNQDESATVNAAFAKTSRKCQIGRASCRERV